MQQKGALKTMIHYYYGYGKGKTSAALGLGIRACGAGKKVTLLQFLKDNHSAERHILQSLPEFQVLPNPEHLKFTNQMNQSEKEEAALFWQNAFYFAQKAPYDVLILDEVTDALKIGFLPRTDLLLLLHHFPQNRELILTGHEPDPEIEALCDYVTEMKKKKHPFDHGAKARAGIEF